MCLGETRGVGGGVIRGSALERSEAKRSVDEQIYSPPTFSSSLRSLVPDRIEFRGHVAVKVALYNVVGKGGIHVGGGGSAEGV